MCVCYNLKPPGKGNANREQNIHEMESAVMWQIIKEFICYLSRFMGKCFKLIRRLRERKKYMSIVKDTFRILITLTLTLLHVMWVEI
jgi:hypothetical protein